MNDKAIRDILIAWLQAMNHEIRIYQEKSIGSSICDVMAVTDKLTGYEIKNLRIILSREKQTLEAARQELEQLDEKITKARTRWLTSMTAAVHLKKYGLEDFKSAYQSIKNLLTDEVITGSKQAHLPKVLGFRLALPQPQDQKKPYILLCYSDQKYLVPMGDTPNGNARRVISMLKDFDKTLTEVK
jgi:hypothetical protein